MQITLVDTGFLVAAASPKDINHERAKAALREMRGVRVVSAPVLPEMFYMLTKRASYRIATAMFDRVRTGGFQIENLTSEDMARMREIIGLYVGSDFDFVDMALMAVSERLKITEVYTFDRRDFEVFRPSHCSYLELLP